MAKRYSAVKPPPTGSPGLIRTGGGRARVGSLPKTPKASFSIDMNLGQLREQHEHRQRVKELQDSGLYEGVNLSLIPPPKLALMHADLAKNLRSYAEKKLEGTRAREGGTYLQDQASLRGEPPRNWVGSEYDISRSPQPAEDRKVSGIEPRETPIIPPVDTDKHFKGLFNKPRGELPLEEPVPEGMGSALPLMKALGGGGVQEETFTEDITAPSISTPSIPRSQTRAEEGLAAFLGLSPEVATGVFAEHKEFQEELGKEPKVPDLFKNTKEVTKINKKGETIIQYFKKGTKEQVGGDMNVGVLDYTKGERMFTMHGFDANGNPQVTVRTLDAGLNVIKSKVFAKGTGPEGKTVPKQVLLLSTFLMDKAIEDHPSGKEFEDMNEAEQSTIFSVLDTARNPAAYFKTPAGERNLQEFVDFMKEKNMAEIMVDIFKEINKMDGGGNVNPYVKQKQE